MLSVMANSRNSRPTMSPIKSSGISTATSETVNVVYTPIRAIALTFTAAYIKRDSNVPAFQFNDFTGSVNVTYRFFRYGDNTQ